MKAIEADELTEACVIHAHMGYLFRSGSRSLSSSLPSGIAPGRTEILWYLQVRIL